MNPGDCLAGPTFPFSRRRLLRPCPSPQGEETDADDDQTEHVGSLLRPGELLAARAGYRRGELSAEQLARSEDFMASVVEPFGVLVPAEESSALSRWYRDTDGAELEGEVAPVTIGEPLYRKTPLPLTEAQWMAWNAPGPFKITMASPTVVAGFCRPGVSDRVYPDRWDAVDALAALAAI